MHKLINLFASVPALHRSTITHPQLLQVPTTTSTWCWTGAKWSWATASRTALWLWWSRSPAWWSTLTRHRRCAEVTTDPIFFWFLQRSFHLGVCRINLPLRLCFTAGYWPSYNVPFHQKIYSLSGYGQMWEEYGEDFSYDLCPRAKIFRRDQADVKDLDSLKHIMRSNGVWLRLIFLVYMRAWQILDYLFSVSSQMWLSNPCNKEM